MPSILLWKKLSSAMMAVFVLLDWGIDGGSSNIAFQVVM